MPLQKSLDLILKFLAKESVISTARFLVREHLLIHHYKQIHRNEKDIGKTFSNRIQNSFSFISKPLIAQNVSETSLCWPLSLVF
jgi:hypothetical protein